MGRMTWLLLGLSLTWGMRVEAQRYADVPPPGGAGMYRAPEGGVPPVAPLDTQPRGPLPEPGSAQVQGLNQPLNPAYQPAGGVAPIAGQSPGVEQIPAAEPVDSKFAEQLMAAALRRPATSQLSGTPVTLHEVVSTATSRSEQSNRVNCYWDLCSAVSDYYLSLHEQTELKGVAAATGGNSQVMRSALEKMQRRLDTALTAARASQSQLAALMGRSGSAPLPGDLPLCVSYEPRFSLNFPTGAPPEAVALNQLLPLRHAELLDAASNVDLSQKLFDQVVDRAGQDYAAREVAITKALELLALNRRAFVQIARDYNRRITRYTELAKPGTVGTERLVAMLIKTDPSQTARQTPPTSRYDDRRSDVTPPPTFQDDWTPAESSLTPDEGVQPAGYEEASGGNGATSSHLLPGEASVLGNGAP